MAAKVRPTLPAPWTPKVVQLSPIEYAWPGPWEKPRGRKYPKL